MRRLFIFCHGNSGNASERAVSVSASAPLGGDGCALPGVTGKAGKACAAGKREQENLTGKNSKGKKRYGARGRGRTDTESLPRDFKSLVSTDSTIRAREESGGAFRSRTGLDGFAIRYITALLTRQILQAFQPDIRLTPMSFKLERETRLELATPTLARSCSTN